MDLTLESKACAACAKAKRRCGKQIPTCGRCASKGIRCEYSQGANTFSVPPLRPSDDGYFSHSQDQVQSADSTVNAPLQASVSDTLLDLPEGPSSLEELLSMDFDYTVPPGVLDLNSKAYSLPWYLESASWDIGYTSPAEITHPFCHSVFMRYVEKIQKWQSCWIDTGSNPYIHKHLYKFNMPRCILDAFTFLSTYINATPEIQPVVLRMLEDRVRQLLLDQPTKKDDALTPLEHLARVQALHIYQTIGLFNGGIRARHVAETQIPTLNDWMRAMIDSAKTTASLGKEPFARTLFTPRRDAPKHQDSSQDQTIGFYTADYIPNLPAGARLISAEDAAWYSWILSESIRRTWMVAAATQSVFLAMQVKYAPCPGSTMFTTRRDLWEAGSAYAWASKRQQHGVDEDGLDFARRDQWGQILESRRPDQVDEFTTTTLEVTFGSERLEQWSIEMGSRDKTL